MLSTSGAVASSFKAPDDAQRLRAHDRVEMLLVRADRHGHDELAGLGLTERRQHASLVHGVAVDFAVLGIRDIDKSLRGSDACPKRNHGDAEREQHPTADA
jgi:hypothetical protein